MILIIIIIQSLKELPSNLNMVCSSRILGLLTTLVNIFSNMKTLSFFLVHVQRLWKWNDFQKSYLTNLKKNESDSVTFFVLGFYLFYIICNNIYSFHTQFNGL